MAKTENVTDDLTHEEITYPYISARSLRVELSPTKYVWMGINDLMYFASGGNLGKWAEEQMKKIVEAAEDERSY